MSALRTRMQRLWQKAAPLRFKDETNRWMKKPPRQRELKRETINIESDSIESTPESVSDIVILPSTTRRQQDLAISSDIAILPSPAPRLRDLAISFLNYLTIAGRSLESTRGFLEYICPVFVIEGHNFVLAAAVNATTLDHGRV